MSSNASAAVVGSTGYGGAELVGLLHKHPSFSPDYLTSRSYVGEPFSSVYPRFKGSVDQVCESLEPERLTDYDLVFFALPHGKSMEIINRINPSDTHLIDLAADYRLDDPDQFESVYDTPHRDPEGLAEAVFGLPEYFEDEIRDARIVACPGCYVTASLVPLVPLVREDLVQGPLFIDAKSGVSGAGRSPSEANTFVNCNDNIKPYKVARHRHAAEIEQCLTAEGPTDVGFSFVPHVNAMDHGIEAAIYFQVESSDQTDRVRDRLRSIAGDHELIRYFEEPAGVKPVVKTPYCDLSVTTDGDRVILFSVLDNLWKGAASQAVQNANLMFNRPVAEGLVE